MIFEEIDSTLQTHNITVDWNEIEETSESINDKWEDYGAYERNITRVQQRDLQKALENTYKNTIGKLLMEYGSLVEPLVENAEQVQDAVEVNPTCDNECGMRCFQPDTYDFFNSTWVYNFNQTCFHACGCQFKFESWNATQQDQLVNDIENLEDNLDAFEAYGARMSQTAQNILVPALERYNQRSADLQNEYLKTVRATAIEDLGCDSTCVNYCTNGYYVTFYDLSSCIDLCYCDGLESAINLDDGTYNMPQLVLYAKGSKQALSALYRNKNKF